MITTIVFDAFGTLFKVSEGGSAKRIMNNIIAYSKEVDYASFVEEWKSYYKCNTTAKSVFRTERDIFISRIKNTHNELKNLFYQFIFVFIHKTVYFSYFL